VTRDDNWQPTWRRPSQLGERQPATRRTGRSARQAQIRILDFCGQFHSAWSVNTVFHWTLNGRGGNGPGFIDTKRPRQMSVLQGGDGPRAARSQARQFPAGGPGGGSVDGWWSTSSPTSWAWRTSQGHNNAGSPSFALGGPPLDGRECAASESPSCRWRWPTGGSVPVRHGSVPKAQQPPLVGENCRRIRSCGVGRVSTGGGGNVGG